MMIPIKTESAWRTTADVRQCIVRVLRSGFDTSVATLFSREGLVEPLDKHGRIYRVLDVDRLLAPSD